MNILKRHIGQKVALATSVFCTLLALPVFGIFLWLLKERGMQNTWIPSALSTVFFLFFCAVVLYVMSRPQPELPSADAVGVD